MSGNITQNLQIPATLRPSRVKWAGVFGLCLMFVLGGVWMVREGERAGYFVAGVFAIGLPVALLQFHPKAAYLKLTSEGFTYCGLFRTHTVRWAQVMEFGIVRIHNLMVAWNFTPDSARPGRTGSFIKSLYGYEAALPDTYGMKPQELLVLMESLRQKFGNRNTP